jgi:hypothetical protein
MNDVVFNWIDLLVFLAAMASCGTIVGLACRMMKGARYSENQKKREAPRSRTQAVAKEQR